MTKSKKNNDSESMIVDENFFTEFWEESWTYIKTVVDVLGEPILILDEDCHVLAANQAFHTLFKVDRSDIEGNSIYTINNGAWNIPALQQQLKSIVLKNTFFNGFEMIHEFPILGKRTLVLNARHIHTNKSIAKKHLPPIIMLSMDDVSEIHTIANRLAAYTNMLEKSLSHQTQLLEHKILMVEEQLKTLKRR